MALVRGTIEADETPETDGMTDDELDPLMDDVSAAIEMGLSALVENLKAKFPNVAFVFKV